MAKARPNLPTPLEIQRAIYLDFEGFEALSPWMASVRCDGRTETVVFGDQSRELALAAEATGLRVEPLREFLGRISDRAREEGRRIAAYSSRELQVFKQEGVNAEFVGESYLDVRGLAVPWRRQRHPEVEAREKRLRARRRARGLWHDPSGNSLLAMAKLAGVKTTSCYGKGKTTSRLKAVADQIASKGGYAGLTSTVKRKWTNLIKHNRWDCEACELLLAIAVSDLTLR